MATATAANGFNPNEVKTPVGNFMEGHYVPGDGTEYEVIRPSDGRVIRTERGASAGLVEPRHHRRGESLQDQRLGGHGATRASQSSVSMGRFD